MTGSPDETSPRDGKPAVTQTRHESSMAAFRPLLFSIAYGMTGSVGDAEDIVQDAFLGMTRALQAGTVIADRRRT